MTCKDCYHYGVCAGFMSSKSEPPSTIMEEDCRDFKDKSRIVELPMPVAEWLREELTEHYYRCIGEL